MKNIKRRSMLFLNKAKRLSDKRNELIHRPWAQDENGEWLVKDEGHTWGTLPTKDELNSLAKSINHISMEINAERLLGFISEIVANRPKIDIAAQ